MANHWSSNIPHITEKQAYALDRMAEAHNLGTGLHLLLKVSGRSSSKLAKSDRLTMRRYIDECFKLYGGQT